MSNPLPPSSPIRLMVQMYDSHIWVQLSEFDILYVDNLESVRYQMITLFTEKWQDRILQHARLACQPISSMLKLAYFTWKEDPRSVNKSIACESLRLIEAWSLLQQPWIYSYTNEAAPDFLASCLVNITDSSLVKPIEASLGRLIAPLFSSRDPNRRLPLLIATFLMLYDIDLIMMREYKAARILGLNDRYANTNLVTHLQVYGSNLLRRFHGKIRGFSPVVPDLRALLADESPHLCNMQRYGLEYIAEWSGLPATQAELKRVNGRTDYSNSEAMPYWAIQVFIKNWNPGSEAA
ncbi:hypothetical protein F4777DRAFT_584332 [Nemania sp. FL0916]|nr:hypothetical protein F4777DRAFT_584332 [Nemania sp. FL0916]